MTTELAVYQFKEYPIRITLDDKGEPWFVAKDVCDVLGLSHVTNALKPLDIEEKGSKPITTPGGIQQMTVISESGRYRLAMRCDKPQAKPFQDWVVKEVLPSIRKTGSYSVEPLTTTSALKEFARGLVAVADKLESLEQRMDKYEDKQKTLTAVLAPVKEVSTRSKISQVVREYAHNNGGDYRVTFRVLFTEFKYRYGIDLTQRTRNNGNKTIMDTAEELGCLDDLFALAVKLFVGK